MTFGPYRVGPWPGLTPSGATVLLSCALLLALGQFMIGPPRQAWPDLILLAVAALIPLVLATRIIKAPGVASAVCGAYLLPRTLISLIEPSIEPPPLLLMPALAYDISLWLRVSDVRRRRDRRPRRITSWRAAFAGAIFGLVLSLIVPPFAILLGGDAANWSGAALWAAVLGNGLGCALIGLSARGTGS